MRISNRARNLTIWFAAGLLMSPLSFNCHSRTDQAPAISQDSDTHPDDTDQTVRAMTTEDGAPVSESKVRLSGDATISSAKAAALGMSGKLTSSSDSVVPKGTKLLALYDNDCRKKSGSPLRFEAEAFVQSEDVSLAKFANDAENQECLVRVDENRTARWVKPTADMTATSDSNSNSTSGAISAQATTNDSRITEARQIAFTRTLQAWDWFYSGAGLNRDVIVAVVDTGVLYTHPDLAENIYTNAAGNHGIDYANGDNNPIDDAGHGTHVAGIIGVSGIIGTRVKIMAVKVLDNEGSGTESDIVNGIRYAADQGAHVINMSLGGNFPSPSIRDAMIYATNRGVVVVVAAGNDGVSMNATDNFYAPACYSRDIPGALTVGAVNAVTGAVSSFSNFSPNYVWISAPGSNGILSTYLGNGYMTIDGTSMASPAVAGTAALLVGAFRSNSIAYTPADIVNLLTESARPVSTQTNLFRSGATLDVERTAKLFFSRYIMSGNGGTEIE